MVYGLEVSAETGSTSLSITQGLSLNRRGESLYLPEDVKLDLIPASEPYAQEQTFCACTTELISTGKGAYILVISPASGLQEIAPMSGLFAAGTISGCGSKYAVEGVQFRLVKLDVGSIKGIRDSMKKELNDLMNKTDAASTSKLRNILTYLCSGTTEVSDFVRAPYNLISSGSRPVSSSFAEYGVPDRLRSMEILTDHDVPLAVVCWSAEMIKFVDMWSVRRKLTERSHTGSWNLFTGSRLMAEAEAVFLQFQGQIEQIIQSKEKLESIVAAQYFSYLPAAGMIPVSGSYLNEYMKNIEGKPPGTAQAGGFNPANFFKGLTTKEPVVIEGVKLEDLMRDSLSCTPIDLARKEMIWLYLVRENLESIATSPGAVQPYMIFTSGHVPYYYYEINNRLDVIVKKIEELDKTDSDLSDEINDIKEKINELDKTDSDLSDKINDIKENITKNITVMNYRLDALVTKTESITKITNSIGMKFVLIPKGDFMMGSDFSSEERPKHKVTIHTPFYLGIYPVTQLEWQAIMKTNPSRFTGNNLPVERVLWEDIQDFIELLNKKEGTDKYRLPSEAEWEYAARAGTTTDYFFGDAESDLGNYAWFDKNSKSTTHPVGQKLQNTWELYDIYGNVGERVQDTWHENYNGAPNNGSAREGSSSRRVIRGGSWGDNARFCRSAVRKYDGPGNRNSFLGFRLLREL